MSAETLLARLDGVKPYGRGWRAICPSCGGRSGKVSITDGDDGRVLVHCFGGCSALEVVQAAGLDLTDLFPERISANDTPEDRRRIRRAAREGQWAAALAVLQFEARVVTICARDMIEGRELDWDDFCRLVKAAERIEDAEQVLSDKPEQRAREAIRSRGST